MTELTLVERVFDALAADDGDNSEHLAHVYASSSPTQKQAIDAAFLCLCGYSLETLINGDN